MSLPKKNLKFFLFQFFVIIGIFLFANNVRAEEIKNYDVKVNVNKDGTLNIVEKIEYDFGATSKHGIYRIIPIKDKNYDIDISNIEVTDENGDAYWFAKKYNFDYTSYFFSWINLQIGYDDELVSGVKTYVIKYKVAKAITYLKDSDQLYWNLIGNKWDVPIKNVSAAIILPEKVDNYSLPFKCFVGALGSQNECTVKFSVEDNKTRIDLDNLSNLDKNQAVTVLINLPKNVVLIPTKLQVFLYFVGLNPVLFLPIIIFIVLYFIWLKNGRDPKGRGAIIAQYDAPNDLRPIEIGTIVDEECNNRDIVAEIIYLAVKGYLKIIKLDEKDYLFQKLKDGHDLINGHDKAIFNILFEEVKESVKLSELKTKAKDFSSLRNSVYNGLIKNKIFNNNPGYIKNLYFVFSVFFFAIIVVIVLFAEAYVSWFNILGLFLSSVLFFVFALHMSQKSQQGAELKGYILGLKLYLEVAEKDRLKFHNAPEKNPEHFEKLLPYAIALGVEKEWTKLFENMYDKPMAWYEAGPPGHFNPVYFSQSLSSFSSSFGSSVFPANSSGPGGGFAGGGFGGGGGGSW